MKKLSFILLLTISIFISCEDQNLTQERSSPQLREAPINDSDELILQQTSSDASGGVNLSLGIIKPLDANGRVQIRTSGKTYIEWRVLVTRESTDPSVSIHLQWSIITSPGLNRLYISPIITTNSFPSGETELLYTGTIEADPGDISGNICLEVQDYIAGGPPSIITRECKTTIPFSQNCSCTDDAGISGVKYQILNSSEYRYEITWHDLPSGYPTVELGYFTNSGNRVVIKDDFGLCQSGCAQLVAPNFTLSDGPKSFWINARSPESSIICDGFFRSSSYLQGTINPSCEVL